MARSGIQNYIIIGLTSREESDLPNLESLTLGEEPLPRDFELVQINERAGMEVDILRRYFSHLPVEEFPQTREKLQRFGEICQRREKEEEEGAQSPQTSLLTLGPEELSENGRAHLEDYLRSREIPEGFHLFEISLAAGDIFFFTYLPRKIPRKKGQVTRDRENRRCLVYFSSLPAGFPLFPYPSPPLNRQLHPGEEMKILFAGDGRTNAENFLRTAVVTFIQEELQRETGSKGEPLPYTVPLNGKRYKFYVTPKGNQSLEERILEEVKELDGVDLICLLVNIDVGKQEEVVKTVESAGKMVLVGYSASMELQEVGVYKESKKNYRIP